MHSGKRSSDGKDGEMYTELKYAAKSNRGKVNGEDGEVQRERPLLNAHQIRAKLNYTSPTKSSRRNAFKRLHQDDAPTDH